MSSRWGRIATATALAALLFLASGCVEITTRVTSRGRIEREIKITVDAKHAKSAASELRQMVRRGWRIERRREGEKVTFICRSRGLRCDPPADVGITLGVRRRGLTAEYRYTERPQIKKFIPAREEQEFVGNTPVRYVIEMPGEILPETVPIGFSLEGKNRIVAETTLGLLPERQIEVRSVARRWVDLVFLVAFALTVPGYVGYVVFARRRTRALRAG